MPNNYSTGAPLDAAFAKQVRLSPSDLERILTSAIFDERFYLLTYSDIALAGKNPPWHFIVCGRFEKRKPSANFDPIAYERANPGSSQNLPKILR